MATQGFAQVAGLPQIQAPARVPVVSVNCSAREPARTRSPCARAAAVHEDRRAVLVGTLGLAAATVLTREASAKGLESLLPETNAIPLTPKVTVCFALQNTTHCTAKQRALQTMAHRKGNYQRIAQSEACC